MNRFMAPGCDRDIYQPLNLNTPWNQRDHSTCQRNMVKPLVHSNTYVTIYIHTPIYMKVAGGASLMPAVPDQEKILARMSID